MVWIVWAIATTIIAIVFAIRERIRWVEREDKKRQKYRDSLYFRPCGERYGGYSNPHTPTFNSLRIKHKDPKSIKELTAALHEISDFLNDHIEHIEEHLEQRGGN